MTDKRKADMPAVQAVIVTWNKKADVMQLLDQLNSLDYPAERLGIAVIDNHSDDGTGEAVESSYPRVRLLRNRENLGGTGGFNAGMRWVLKNRPEAEYLWLLDNDVRIERNTLGELVEVMENTPDAALCGSKIMNVDQPDEMIEIGAFIDYRLGEIRRNLPHEAAIRNPKAAFEVDYVAACSMLARIRYVKKAGIWHDKLFIYWDDMEWGARFKQLGYKVLASNASLVFHPNWAGREVDNSAVWRSYYRTRNSLWFFNNYSAGLKRRLLLSLMLLRLTRSAKIASSEGRFALSRAFIQGGRDFFTNCYGKKEIDMPFDDLEAYLDAVKPGNLCIFIHDPLATEPARGFLCDLLEKYPGMRVLAVLPEGDRDKWEGLSHENDIVTYTRSGDGSISWRNKYRIMRFLRTRSWDVFLTSPLLPRMGAVWGKNVARVDFETGLTLSVEKIGLKDLMPKSFSIMPYTFRVLFDLPEKESSAPEAEAAENESQDNMTKDQKIIYHKWLKRVSPDISLSRKRVAAMTRHPSFSILMPTYNSDISYFREMIRSLRTQTYEHFEVCISDDASTDEAFKTYLEKLPSKDSRFRVMMSDKNGGIAANTRRAMGMAGGEFLVLCDHDDLITGFALESFASYINAHPEADVLYSDEDMIDAGGVRHSPRLQPDWNPDLLTSHMYCPHLIAVKADLARNSGVMEPGTDGAQDYDLLLRVTEKARHIGHVPLILYSWRSAPGSIATDCSEKMYAYEAGRNALENAMKRRGEDAVVVKVPGTNLGVYRVKRRVPNPDVTHIVEGRTPEVVTAIRSIRLVSQVPVKIIAVIEEGRANIADVLEEFPDVEIRMVPEESGRAVFYNQGARAAESRFLFFSAGNAEILDSEYPLAALEHTGRPDIGAVGVKITYPNGRFYHTGMIMGINGLCGYAHRNTQYGSGYFNSALCIRNYSAVSWDIMAVDSYKWEEVGGFDETLPFYGDADFCLKLREKGYRNIYTPYIAGVLKRKVHNLDELRHKEAADILIERHGTGILDDPYYHPLLSREFEDFSVKRV
ncbi:glycosyltransferase [Desulfococcaceae bacterium HSG8]|nr:glycosyltransferase [Desulfococcaceae bacterium HSG8]